MSAADAPSVTRTLVPGGRIVRVRGVVDERLELLPALEGASGVVVMDLDGVTQITSSGVRRWTMALGTLGVTYLAFVRTRPCLVAQFNAVDGFAGAGELLSFYGVYTCASCSNEFDVLLDAKNDRASIETFTAPVARCPRCDAVGEFDDIPESYFFHAASKPVPNPPNMIATMLARGDTEPFRFEKSIERYATTLWFSGALDKSTSLKRQGEGLEGIVLIRAGGLTGADDTGISRLDAFARSAPVPLSLLEFPADVLVPWFEKHGLPDTVRIFTLHHRVACPGCREHHTFVWDSHSTAQMQRRGNFTAQCTQCGTMMSVAAPEALQPILAAHPFEKFTPELEGFLRVHHLPPSELRVRAARSRPRIADGQGVPFGRYTLLEHIGQGGMADVYLATMGGLAGFEKRVVIKKILPSLASDPVFVQMFLDEAKLAARIESPYVVQTYDVGQESGAFFMAIEFVAGGDLRAVLTLAKKLELPMPVAAAALVMADVCRGLEAAHGHHDASGQPTPVVHRDVTPHNILVHRGGAKVADFGIAEAAGRMMDTPTGAVRGKIGYVAPELLLEVREQSNHRTDIFSAGIVLYECLTFEHPFRRETAASTTAATLSGPLKPPSSIRADIPKALDTIVAAALERNVAHRYQNARDMRLALDHFLESHRDAANQLSAWLERVAQNDGSERPLRLSGTTSRVHNARAMEDLAATQPTSSIQLDEVRGDGGMSPADKSQEIDLDD